jgi:hypothetical protein
VQRDMDLVRQILLALEQHSNGFPPDELKIDGYTEEQIGYHAYIMGQAGLIEVADVTTMSSSGPEAMIKNMTWHGHEFIEAAREPTRWSEAKQVVEKVGGASFEVWTKVLTALVKKSLDL